MNKPRLKEKNVEVLTSGVIERSATDPSRESRIYDGRQEMVHRWYLLSVVLTNERGSVGRRINTDRRRWTDVFYHENILNTLIQSG